MAENAKYFWIEDENYGWLPGKHIFFNKINTLLLKLLII